MRKELANLNEDFKHIANFFKKLTNRKTYKYDNNQHKSQRSSADYSKIRCFIFCFPFSSQRSFFPFISQSYTKIGL